tara:strand:+ start:482 stop:748 length:267 start_codon:yes stop_codon:yes gene_type:complete
MKYKFQCKTADKSDPDEPCDIQLQETVYQQTVVFPIKVEDSFQLEYGSSDYEGSESHTYYCRNCNEEFNYAEVLELIVEDIEDEKDSE